MNINLIAIGKLKEDYLRSACGEYIKRLGRYCTFKLYELDECRLSDAPSDKEISAALKKEAVQIKNMRPDLLFQCASRENSFPVLSFRKKFPVRA